jgi:hypothetical protein
VATKNVSTEYKMPGINNTRKNRKNRTTARKNRTDRKNRTTARKNRKGNNNRKNAGVVLGGKRRSTRRGRKGSRRAGRR